MKLFASTLNQMGVLGLYMAIGFIIGKLKIIPKEASKISSKLKSFINPMFIALIIGAVIGVSGLGEIMLKADGGKGIFITQVIKVLGDCMSPIAMIMTGITFAFIDFKSVLKTASIYVVTFVRLLAFPLVFGGIALLVKTYIVDIPFAVYASLICSLSMPLGLNTVVIPAAYGKDTSIPAGMALISHLISIATIPLIILIFI